MMTTTPAEFPCPICDRCDRRDASVTVGDDALCALCAAADLDCAACHGEGQLLEGPDAGDDCRCGHHHGAGAS